MPLPTWMISDFDALEQTILRPPGRRWEEARTVVAGLGSPTEAWLALEAAGRTPEAWRGDDAARFHRMRAATTRHRYGNCHTPCLCDDGVLAATPARVFDALVLGSDPAGLSAAEELAREGVRRLAPWTRPGELRDRIVWAVSRGRETVRRTHLNALDSVRLKLQNVLRDAGDRSYFEEAGSGTEASARADGLLRRLQTAGVRPGFLANALIDLWALGRSWRHVSELGLRVPEGFLEPIEAEGLRFADLPDPLEPWWRLWWTGYFPWAVSREGVLLGAHGPLDV